MGEGIASNLIAASDMILCGIIFKWFRVSVKWWPTSVMCGCGGQTRSKTLQPRSSVTTCYKLMIDAWGTRTDTAVLLVDFCSNCATNSWFIILNSGSLILWHWNSKITPHRCKVGPTWPTAPLHFCCWNCWSLGIDKNFMSIVRISM